MSSGRAKRARTQTGGLGVQFVEHGSRQVAAEGGEQGGAVGRRPVEQGQRLHLVASDSGEVRPRPGVAPAGLDGGDDVVDGLGAGDDTQRQGPLGIDFGVLQVVQVEGNPERLVVLGRDRQDQIVTAADELDDGLDAAWGVPAGGIGRVLIGLGVAFLGDAADVLVAVLRPDPVDPVGEAGQRLVFPGAPVRSAAGPDPGPGAGRG